MQPGFCRCVGFCTERSCDLRGSQALGRVTQLEGGWREGLSAEMLPWQKAQGDCCSLILRRWYKEVVARGRVNAWPKKERKKQRVGRLYCHSKN